MCVTTKLVGIGLVGPHRYIDAWCCRNLKKKKCLSFFFRNAFKRGPPWCGGHCNDLCSLIWANMLPQLELPTRAQVHIWGSSENHSETGWAAAVPVPEEQAQWVYKIIYSTCHFIWLLLIVFSTYPYLTMQIFGSQEFWILTLI